MKNENIIQVGGKSYIKAKVVMLPTEKAYKGCILKEMQALEDRFRINNDTYNYQYDPKNLLPQHLYFLSDEITVNNSGIKIGEYVIKKWGLTFELIKYDGTCNTCFKIIASTDESLRWNDNNDIQIIDVHHCKFPRPSNEFLQAYCKANGKIEEVLVEVEALCFNDSDKSLLDDKGLVKLQYKLKVSPDNTVTIKRVEEKMYSREETKKRMLLFGIKIMQEVKNHTIGDFDQDKWIEENL